MSYAPCKNPHCKSNGRPHPNCRCYGEMSEGGDVSYCSGQHNPECEYFADGGSVDFDSMKEDAPQKFDDIKEDAPSGFDAMVDDKEKYSTTGQRVGAALEGAAQGIVGPLAPLAEKGLSSLGVPGLSTEEQAARERINPIEHGAGQVAGLAGSMLTGVGEAALFGKAAEAAAQFSGLGKIGSSVIKGALSNGLIQGSDEVSKAILGEGDPEHPIAAGLMSAGAAGLFGGALGGVGGVASKGLEKIAESKIANKLMSYIAGIGHAAQNPAAEREVSGLAFKKFFDKGLAPEGMSHKDFLAGEKYFDNGLNMASKATGSGAGGLIGEHLFGEYGKQLGTLLGYGMSDKIQKLLTPAAKKYVTPIVMKVLSTGNTEGLMDIFGHANKVASGYATMGKALDSLFKAGAIKSSNEISEKAVDKLDKYIKNGGIDQNVQQQIYDDQNQPQGFAEGGTVEPIVKPANGMEVHYPEQNMLLNVAKGRVSNYLKSLQPNENPGKLAFDPAPDNRQQEKSYRRALKIAVNPLHVMDEIHNGTIEPQDLKHLNALYPEVSGLLQKKITEKIIKSQMDGTRPSSKVRQGLSMFMGTALSSEYSPQNIQAAQAVFAMKPKPQEQGQPVTKNKKSTSSLTKSDDAYLTSSQARVSRQQRP